MFSFPLNNTAHKKKKKKKVRIRLCEEKVAFKNPGYISGNYAMEYFMVIVIIS